MTLRRPVVNISGDRSELPPGDTIVNGVAGVFTAGSGLQIVGDGNLANDVEVDVNIAPNPSGLIFVNNKFLALDGRAQVTGDHAIASGNYALETSTIALASGAAAKETADTALASGLAALTDINKIRQGTVVKYTTGSPVASGSPVGFDNANAVNPISIDNNPFAPPLSGDVVGIFAGWTGSAGTYQPPIGAFNDTDYVFAGENSLNDVFACAVFYDPDSGVVTSGDAVRMAPPGTATSVHLHVYDKAEKKFAINYIEAATHVKTVLAQVSGTTVISGGTYVLNVRGTSSLNLQSAYSPTMSGFGYVFYSNISAQRHFYYLTAALSGNTGGPVIEDSLISGGTIELGIDRTNWNGRMTITDQGNNNSFFTHSNVTAAPFTRFLKFLSISGEYHKPVMLASGVFTAGVNNTNNKSTTYHPVVNKNYIFTSDNTNAYVETAELSGSTIIHSSGVRLDTTTTTAYRLTASLDEHNNQTNVIWYQNGTSPSDPYFHLALTPSGNSFATTSAVSLFASNTTTSYAAWIAQNSGSSSFPIIYGAETNRATNSLTYSTTFSPLKDGKLSYIGVAQTLAPASGDIVEVRLPGSYDKANNESFAPGTQVYVASGKFTSTGAEPIALGVEGWKSVGRAIDSSTILLTDMLP